MVGDIFGRVLGKSPFGPIKEHVDKVNESAKLLIPFMDSVLTQDWEKATQIKEQIVNLEIVADEIKLNLRLFLQKSLLLPVPRSELLQILEYQDMVANLSKEIAETVLVRRMSIPQALSNPFVEFLTNAVNIANRSYKAISELEDLLEVGFKGREVEIASQLADDVHKAETKNEKLGYELKVVVCGPESDLQPLEVFFLYQVVNQIEKLSKTADKIASHFQLLLAR
jgi:predicted phosphate transport protein (TIGR00153 family)